MVNVSPSAWPIASVGHTFKINAKIIWQYTSVSSALQHYKDQNFAEIDLHAPSIRVNGNKDANFTH